MCQIEKIVYFSRVKTEQEKEKEKTSSDEPTVPLLQASVQSSNELVHKVQP
jgi:hypothetical protein